MKTINYVKLALDVVMSLLFVLFFNKNVLGGLRFHEISGLFFAGAFLIHILLNLGWVKRVTLKMFNRSLSWRVRGSYALNLLLLISMTFIIVSGILISHVVFPNINVGNENWFKMTHISVSFVVLVLVGIHVGLHWEWVVNIVKKMASIKKRRAWVRYVAQGLTLVILLFGLYQINQTSFVHRLTSSVSAFSLNTQQAGFDHKENFKNRAPDFERDETFKNRAQGRMREGDFSGREGKFGFNRGERGGNVNVASVIFTYTGIVAVFVILTYYLKRLSLSRKKRPITTPNRGIS